MQMKATVINIQKKNQLNAGIGTALSLMHKKEGAIVLRLNKEIILFCSSNIALHQKIRERKKRKAS